MIKKVVSIILICLILSVCSVRVIAASVSELQDKQEELKDKQEEVEAQRDDVTEEKESVMEEVVDLTSQIAEYEAEIEELNDKIDSLESSITNTEEEIQKLEKETKEKEELLLQRLVAMYESGQTTYLDALLGAESITAFISKYYMIEEIAEADQTVIDSIKEKQAETENKKQQLVKEKREVDESKEEVEQKNESLQRAKQEKQLKVDELAAKEDELQAQIDEFEAAIQDAQDEIDAAIAAANNSGGSYEGSFSGMFDWPVSYSAHNANIITSVFGYRDQPTIGASTNHGAVDIAVRYVPVYAPADGKVIIAKWLSGYGNYVMIDHGDGYYTGFGHLSSFNVSAGQTVSRGQQIATSGNTGISTGPHLHYEVYIGGTDNYYRVDPLQYTSHPSLIYY